MIREINDLDRKIIYPIIENEFNTVYKEDSAFTNWLIYVDNNRIIGFLNYDLIYDTIEIEYIYVEKEFRNKNIASKLMENMFKTFEKKDIHSISLEVNCNNIPAINLYKKYAFETITIRKNYYGKDDAYLMLKRW